MIQPNFVHFTQSRNQTKPNQTKPNQTNYFHYQEVGSEDLGGIFPSIDQLGLGLVTILDQMRIRT